jgi:hypothetical protein
MYDRDLQRHSAVKTYNDSLVRSENKNNFFHIVLKYVLAYYKADVVVVNYGLHSL